MSKATKQSQSIKHRLVKIILLGALALTTLMPFAVNAASDQRLTTVQGDTTPTPEPIKPPAEQMVSWNT